MTARDAVEVLAAMTQRLDTKIKQARVLARVTGAASWSGRVSLLLRRKQALLMAQVALLNSTEGD